MSEAVPAANSRTRRLLGLGQALRVEPAEARPLALLWLHSLCTGIAIVPLYTAGNALFLAHFSTDWLPHAYIAATVMGVVAAAAYGRARRRLTTARLFSGLLLTILAGVFVLRLGLAIGDAAWAAFVLLGFQSVTKALLNVEFWGLAGQLFTVRQGKRLFGLAGSGELMAMVLGGLATPILVALLGTENLLFVAAAGLLGCLFVLLALVRRHGRHLARRQQQEEREGVRESVAGLARHPYTLSIFLLAAVGVASHRLVDFAFLDQTRVRFQDPDELAQLFGVFFGCAQAVTFLLLTFVTGPVLSRFGIATGMLFRRLALTACTVASLLVLVLAGPAPVLFWLALAAKFSDLVLFGAMTTPAFLVLYQPLRPDRRLSTQMTVESLVGPLASGAAAAAILLLGTTGLPGAMPVAVLTLGVLIAWRFVARRTNAGYRAALPEALEHRRLEGVSIRLEEGDLQRVLHERLGSARPHEVLYALDLLIHQLGEGQAALLGPLIEHPLAPVRGEAMRRIAALDLRELTDAVQARLEREAEPEVLAASLRALAELQESDAVDLLGVYLDHDDETVGEAALIGLLRSGGVDGILIAGERLLAMERSEEPHLRERAARILGEVGVRSFYRHLLDLLWDPDADVRRAALAAAGKVANPRLWPAVIDNLDGVAFHASAVQALVEAGAAAVPALSQALSDPSSPAGFRARIADVCGRIGGDAAIDALRPHMDVEDRHLRTAVLEALDRAGYRATDADGGNIGDILWQELGDAAWVMAARVDIGGAPEAEPLQRALVHRIRQIRARCLLLLSFSGNDQALKRAGEQLSSASAAQRAYALEVLDTALSGDLRRNTMPVFEDLEPAQTLRRMAADFPQRQLGRSERLSLLIVPGGYRMEPWVRACALRSAALLGETGVAGQIADGLDDASRLVGETAAWALRVLSPSLWAEHQERVAEQGLVPPDLLYWIESWKPGDRPMFLTVEKVMVLRAIEAFADVPEEVLAELSGYLEEIEVAADERVYEKGATGRTMYIVAEGRVRVHDGPRTFVELGAGEFFGELTTLDPAPHSATVTALEDAQLLGLDRDALYELMSAHPVVLQGLIHILCQRLRAKGRRT